MKNEKQEMKKANNVLTNFLFFGEVMLEFSSFENAMEDNCFKKSFAGDSYNSCWYFNKLSKKYKNHSCQYLTHLGVDRFSEWLIEEMDRIGIDNQFISQNSTDNIGLYIISNLSNGEREFDYWRENSAAKNLFSDAQSGGLDFEALEQADFIVFSGISVAILAESAREKLFFALVQAKKNNKIIIFDGNFRSKLWPDITLARYWHEKYYSVSNLILPSVEDEMHLFGFTEINEVIAHLHAQDSDEFILKNGSKSAIYGQGGKLVEVHATHVDLVVDTTSAGDSFNAEYLFRRYILNLTPQESIGKAHILAAKVIAKKGALISELFEVNHVF